MNEGQQPSCASDNFVADARYQEIAEAYALDALDAAQNNFGVTLDWTDTSVSQVEQMLGVLHDQRASSNPPEDVVWTFSKMFGSYVGEVYRRNHGATWGIVTLGGESFPGLQSQRSCNLFWPWGKVHNRLTNGPEDNVLHYYQALLVDRP